MKTKDLIREIEKQGWMLKRIRGSHRIFGHNRGYSVVTIPVHGKDIFGYNAYKYTKQAKQLKPEESRHVDDGQDDEMYRGEFHGQRR